MYRVQSKRGKPRYTCGTEKRSNLWENPLDPSLPIGENPDTIGFHVPSWGNPWHILKQHPAGNPHSASTSYTGREKSKLSLPQFNLSILTGMYYNKIRGWVDRETPLFIGDPELLIIIPIVGNCDEMNCRDEKPRIYTPRGYSKPPVP